MILDILALLGTAVTYIYTIALIIFMVNYKQYYKAVLIFIATTVAIILDSTGMDAIAIIGLFAAMITGVIAGTDTPIKKGKKK